MRYSSFQVAKKDIKALFSYNGSRVYSEIELSEILERNRKSWRLPVNMYPSQFINLLIENRIVKKYSFSFPLRTYSRFTWGDVSIFRLVLSLENNAYLSHYTAMFQHDLTDQVPKKIYATYEQPEKLKGNTILSQNSIDNAFAQSPRLSKNVAKFADYNVCLLNGAFTDKLGVLEITSSEDEKIITTDIERTLIDITVRPFYSGGVFEVVSAFKKAAQNVSINKLSAMLKKLDYVYPYHQAIGFYLQKSGVYRETQIKLMRNFKSQRDFYLTNAMKDIEYSKEWKLYYPKGF